MSFEGEHYSDDEISDDPDFPATPLAINFPETFSEREFESFNDGYFHLTPEEANDLIAAIKEAQAKRDQWFQEHPNHIAELRTKIEREEGGYAADGSVVSGWYFNLGWYPDLAEDDEHMLERVERGARYTTNEDPDVQSLLGH